MDNHLQIQIGKLGGSQYDGSLNFHVTPFMEISSKGILFQFIKNIPCYRKLQLSWWSEIVSTRKAAIFPWHPIPCKTGRSGLANQVLAVDRWNPQSLVSQNVKSSIQNVSGILTAKDNQYENLSQIPSHQLQAVASTHCLSGVPRLKKKVHSKLQSH